MTSKTPQPILDAHEYTVQRARGRNCAYVGVSDLCGGLSRGPSDVRDVSKSWVGIDCDATLAEKYPDLPLVICDLNQPFRIARPGVDLIIMTEVLEHLWSPVETLRRLGESFPGVEFLMSVPNGMSFGRIVMAMIKPSKYAKEDLFHTMLFNPATIENTFSAAGFQGIRLIPYTNRAWLSSLVRLRPELASGFFIEGTCPQA